MNAICKWFSFLRSLSINAFWDTYFEVTNGCFVSYELGKRNRNGKLLVGNESLCHALVARITNFAFLKAWL